MKYTKIPETTFQELQLNSGVLLNKFDPDTAAMALENILGATTGGLNFKATPTYSDFGEDIDNCPKNMKEMKKLERWDVLMSGTYVTITQALAKSLVGSADIDDTNIAKIVPRNELLDSDFEDIWFVGDYSDKNDEENGGFVAIHVMNALSTGGFQLKTTDKGKGQFAFEYTGHYSRKEQQKVPFEIYVQAGKDAESAEETKEE